MKDKESDLKRLIRKDCRKAMKIPVLFIAVGDCLTGVFTVFTASIFGSFADAVFKLDLSFGLANLWKLAVCICITVLILPILDMIGRLFMVKYSLAHDQMVFSHFLDKESVDVKKYETGEMQYRLNWDACNMRICWVLLVTKFFMVSVTSIYLLYNTSQISLLFTAVVFALSIIKLIVPMAVKTLQAKYDLQTRDYNAEIRKYETEITEKPYAVKLYGLTKAFLDRLDHTYCCYFKNVFRKSAKCTTIANSISSFLDTFCILVILLIGAALVARRIITAGAVAAMLGYFSVFNTIVGNADYIIRNVPIYHNLVERTEVMYNRKEDTSGINAETVREISAKNLSFDYDGKEVLQNISFTIRVGTKTAICGENGSGKSTLLKLLCGLLKNYSGSLQLNGKEFRTIGIESWRKQFAYAAQDPYLFSGSIQENIRLGNLNSSDEEVKRVMDEIGISYLADRNVSMRQSDLSGGEKQKVSIARALLKNTPFLILDEPSNNLDAESLEWLCEFIKASDKTIIFISHNADLTKIADVEIPL